MATARTTMGAEKTLSIGADKAGSPGSRMVSLDALRGFDMFWISGGEDLLITLFKATGWAWLGTVTGQLEHVPWAGFKAYDLIFPLFVFISGMTLAFSVAKYHSHGGNRGVILRRLFRRALLLVVLGVFYNAGHITFDIANMRLGSVLGRIGLAGLGAGLIMVYSRPRVWAYWAIGILVFYWALLTFAPVPGLGGASYEQGKNMVDFVDQHIMPGKLYMGNHDPEGILSTIPAIASALLGALAGCWLISSRSVGRKVLGLVGAGVVCLGLGWLWGLQFPVIKHLWTSSFVLVTAGWSCLLLAFFYGIVDGIGLRRWAFPFILIGMNPLTLYLLRGTGLINFNRIGSFFFGFLFAHATEPVADLCGAAVTMLVQLLFLYWLFRRKIFLRV